VFKLYSILLSYITSPDQLISSQSPNATVVYTTCQEGDRTARSNLMPDVVLHELSTVICVADEVDGWVEDICLPQPLTVHTSLMCIDSAFLISHIIG